MTRMSPVHLAKKTPPGGPHPTNVTVPTELIRDLNAAHSVSSPQDILRVALNHLGRVALVSSFGADSVVLLHMVAQIDPATPVFFVDTEMLFDETLAYQQQVADRLGLTHVQVLRNGANAQTDPHGQLHQSNPDACCALRKTAPLQTALAGYDAWISGRKQFQSATRQHLTPFQAEPGTARIKVNPLAAISAKDIEAYFNTHALPRHPLVAQGYPSIGCTPCTSPVRPGEDLRAGRWRGQDKTECGIHFNNGTPVREGATP